MQVKWTYQQLLCCKFPNRAAVNQLHVMLVVDAYADLLHTTKLQFCLDYAGVC